MNRKLKKGIKSAFDTPKPIDKNEFFKNLHYQKSNYSDFVFSQIGYIRKRIWMMSSLLIFGVLFGLHIIPLDSIFHLIWIVSSVLPFAALIVVMEISKSVAYKMDELEMSCKYRLYDIVLVRSGILFGLNFFVFVIVSLLFAAKTDYGILQMGNYIFTPYLLTCTLTLAVLNHLRISEASYICGGICCFVSTLNVVVANSGQLIFADKFVYLSSILFVTLLFSTIIQTVKFIRKTEELAWNLQLTD